MKRGLFFYLLISVLVSFVGCTTQVSPTTQPPSAPTLVSVVAISAHRIDIHWLQNGTVTGFQVERTNGRDSTLSLVATVDGSQSTFADTMLQAQTTYLYRVRSVRGTTQSSQSEMMGATTWPPTAAAPYGLTASIITGARVLLAWSYSATIVDSFQVEKRIGQNGYQVLATLSDTARSYIDSGLVASTTYAYRVRAFNISGASAFSNEAGVNTLGLPPLGPTNLHLLLNTPGVVEICWHDNAIDADGYKIQRRLMGQDSFVVIGQRYSFDTVYVDQNISRFTSYEYQVLAFNIYGNSTVSNRITVTTMETLPPVPLLLGVTAASPRSVLVRWQCSIANVDSFHVARKLGLYGNYNENFANLPRNDTAFLDTTCSIMTIYGYKVCSINSIGHSDFSNEDTTKTPDYSPAPPSNLTARAISANRISLYWTVNSTNETGFVIERKIGMNGQFVAISTSLAHLHSWDDFSCANSTIYGYRVYAQGTGGNSPPSNVAYAMTTATYSELGSYNIGATANSIRIEGAMAFVSTDTLGMKILNVANPSNITPVGSVSIPGLVNDVALENDTAFCANGIHGLKILSVTNAAEPALITSYSLLGEATSITVVNHLAYVACGSSGLQIVRVYDTAHLSTAGWYALSDVYSTAEQVVVSGHYAYVAYGWGGALILDITTPANTNLVSNMLVENAQAEGIAVSDSIACVAYGTRGMHIFRITDPANPVEIGAIGTDDFALKVAISGNYAIFADQGAGVKMVNIAQPSAPLYAGSFPTPSRATNLAVVGNTAYVTDLETGIHIVQMNLP